MASEIRPLGHSGHKPAWPANSDHPGNYDNHRDYSRDTFENGADETDSTAATNGWHYGDVRYTATIDPAPSWSTNSNNSSRIYNHSEQLYQHQQPPPPPPPPPSLRNAQHIPPNRHTHFQHTPNPAASHTRFETSRVQFDQPVSPTPSYSTDDIHGGQKNHDNYDNAYSTTTTPDSRTYLRFNGDYNGDDDYISEDAHAPCSETSRSPSRQHENGQWHNLRTPTFDFSPIAHGPDACVIEERGKITFIEQHDEGLILEARSLVEDGPDDPLLMVHTRRYLDPVTVNDPLIHLRLVMPAGQLPRGDAFARISGHLRARYLIDTFLIPHETSHVPSHHDVVLGLSGTLDRVCRALGDLLDRLVHGTDGFVLWKLCLLIPLDIIDVVAEGRRERYNSDPRATFTKCSLPRLKNAMGRVYDSILHTDECILSLQSSSLDVMLDAARCLGEVLVQEEDSQLLCEEFYTGGWPTIIPSERGLPKELTHPTSNLDRLTPLGYILRPEMRECLQTMRVSRYHIQLLMLTRYASELAGDAGTLVRHHCMRNGALITFSGVVPTEDKPIRFCDIGGNTSEALEFAVVEITQWLFQLGFEGWAIKAVVPERIAASWRSPKIVADWMWRGFHHTVDALSGMCKSATHTSAFELEPAEQESVLSIRSKSMAAGLRAAVRAIHVDMYSRVEMGRVIIE